MVSGSIFKKKYTLLFAALLSFVSFINAQSVTFSFKIVDAEDHSPLIGAGVSLGQKFVLSDANGNAVFEISPGTYPLEISYIGYDKHKENITVSQSGNKVIDMNPRQNILNTTTVTAGKYEQPISEVTVSLEILKPRLIENLNATSIDKALEKLPGVSIIDGQVNIRGGAGFAYGAGSRVLVLVDDIPALQPDAGLPNWDDYPVEDMAQVEVLKGASSALYGTTALNGIVNLRTGYAKSEPETKAAVFYTYFDNPKDDYKKWWTGKNRPYETGASLVHKHKWKKLDAVFHGYCLSNSSYNLGFAKNYGRGGTSLRYRINDRLTIGVNANFNKGYSSSFFYWQDDSTGIYKGAPGTGSANNRTRFYIDPYAKYYDANGGRHLFLGRYYYINNQSDNNRANKSNLAYGEYQYQKRFAHSGLTLTGGVVVTATSVTAILYSNQTFSTENYAGYVQLEKKFGDRLNLNAGVRYEINRQHNPDSIPGYKLDPVQTESQPVVRLGANYKLTDGTFLRASFGQAYRYPTVAEKYIYTDIGGAVITPNGNLRSESGWSGEVGLKQGIKISDWGAFADVSAFWMQYNDMIEFSLVSILPNTMKALNIGNTRIKGIEFSLVGEGKIGKIPLRLIAGYTYIDPKYRDYDDSLYNGGKGGTVNYNVLKYRNKHSLKADVEMEFNRLTVGAGFYYYSKIESIDFLFKLIIKGIEQYNETHSNGFKTFDARVSYKITKGLKINLVCRNLLNVEYSVRPGLLEAPRNVTCKLDYTF